VLDSIILTCSCVLYPFQEKKEKKSHRTRYPFFQTSPAASLVCSRLFRHKCSKPSFLYHAHTHICTYLHLSSHSQILGRCSFLSFFFFLAQLVDQRATSTANSQVETKGHHGSPMCRVSLPLQLQGALTETLGKLNSNSQTSNTKYTPK